MKSDPYLVLIGLKESLELGSATHNARLMIFDDVEDYLETDPSEAHEVVVFPDDVADLDALQREVAARGASTIVATEHDAQAAFAAALRLGTSTFVTRPIDGARLSRVTAQEFRTAAAYPAGRRTPAAVKPFVGSSAVIRELCDQVAMMAPSAAPVLVTGESGTGKELVARAIHRLSPRRGQTMLTINCGAIPSDLIESELFGHEKGAFTGAHARHVGAFEAADRGTLFLDEIGELAPGVQVKLLRALQEGTFTRVGGTEPITVDVRFLAATNRDLQTAVSSGAFREDLFYRLNVLRLHLPALRERRGDIRELWDHFVHHAALDEGTEPPESTDNVLEALEGHPWPGNVRELENAARRAVAMRPSRSLTPRALPSQLRGEADAEELRVPGMTLEEIERYAILRTYEHTGSVKRAAEMLDVSERKIFYRLKQYREEDDVDDNDGRVRLALVEDDADLRVAMRELLERSYVVIEYDCLEAVLEGLEDQTPDVIVSDVRLPDGDGLDLLDALREGELDVPVILVTAYATKGMRSEALDRGALALLEKPIDAITLGRHLERAAKDRTTV